MSNKDEAKKKAQKVYENVYHITTEPVAGMPMYKGNGQKDLSITEMIENKAKSDFVEAEGEEAVAKMESKTKRLRGIEEKPTQPNPKRYLVDPATGRIDIDEEEGEYTLKDAQIVSASIKGSKGSDYDSLFNLIKGVRELTGESEGKAAEKPKEYFVEPDTGIIHHEPETGDLTLTEARIISHSLQKVTSPELASPSYVVDDGEVKQIKPGEPIVIKKVVQEPSKTFFINAAGELQEQEPGKPIVIKIQPAPQDSNPPQMMPFPAIGDDGQQVFDREGKPVFVNIDPMMKWLGFKNQERRADERHDSLMGLVKTVRENVGDGIAAIKAAASDVKGTGAKASTPSREQPKSFKCGDCATVFSTPPGWTGQPIKCPNPACPREYTKEELLG